MKKKIFVFKHFVNRLSKQKKSYLCTLSTTTKNLEKLI